MDLFITNNFLIFYLHAKLSVLQERAFERNVLSSPGCICSTAGFKHCAMQSLVGNRCLLKTDFIKTKKKEF